MTQRPEAESEAGETLDLPLCGQQSAPDWAWAPFCGLQASPPERVNTLGPVLAAEQMLGLPTRRGQGWRKLTVQMGLAGTGVAV